MSIKKKSLFVLIPQNLGHFSIEYIFYLSHRILICPPLSSLPLWSELLLLSGRKFLALIRSLFLHFILSYPEVPRPGHLSIYSKASETFCKEKGYRESGRHTQTVFPEGRVTLLLPEASSASDGLPTSGTQTKKLQLAEGEGLCVSS